MVLGSEVAGAVWGCGEPSTFEVEELSNSMSSICSEGGGAEYGSG